MVRLRVLQRNDRRLDGQLQRRIAHRGQRHRRHRIRGSILGASQSGKGQLVTWLSMAHTPHSSWRRRRGDPHLYRIRRRPMATDSRPRKNYRGRGIALQRCAPPTSCRHVEWCVRPPGKWHEMAHTRIFTRSDHPTRCGEKCGHRRLRHLQHRGPHRRMHLRILPSRLGGNTHGGKRERCGICGPRPPPHGRGSRRLRGWWLTPGPPSLRLARYGGKWRPNVGQRDIRQQCRRSCRKQMRRSIKNLFALTTTHPPLRDAQLVRHHLE